MGWFTAAVKSAGELGAAPGTSTWLVSSGLALLRRVTSPTRIVERLPSFSKEITVAVPSAVGWPSETFCSVTSVPGLTSPLTGSGSTQALTGIGTFSSSPHDHAAHDRNITPASTAVIMRTQYPWPYLKMPKEKWWD